MKVLLINAYSTKNKGDFGIVVTIIKELQRNDKDIEIYLEQSFEDMTNYIKYQVNLVKPFIETTESKSFVLKYLYLLKNLFKKVEKYDLVISVGGGYLYSSRKGPLGYGLMKSVLGIYKYSLTNKVQIYPHTAGPLNKIDSLFLSLLLKKVDILYARDQNTFEWASEKKIPVILTNDTVFLNATSSKMICKEKPNTIGLTLVDHKKYSYSSSVIVEKEKKKYLETIASFVNENFTKCNIYIQVDIDENDTDKYISEEFSKLLRCKFEVINLRGNDMFEIIEMYSENDIFLASRMHSAIYALCSGVETIGIGYQPKMEGMYDLLGLSGYSITLESINIGFLEDIYNYNRGNILEMNISIRGILREKLKTGNRHKK
jgi:colanic acid/amylovoran biosynthesis protein